MFRRLFCFMNSLNETGLNDSIFLIMEIVSELKFLSISLRTFWQGVFISNCNHLITKGGIMTPVFTMKNRQYKIKKPENPRLFSYFVWQIFKCLLYSVRWLINKNGIYSESVFTNKTAMYSSISLKILTI